MLQKITKTLSTHPQIYLALFLDFLGFGIFLSYLPILFGSSPYSICPNLNLSDRYFLLGIYLGSFSLMQAIANLIFSKKLNHPTFVKNVLRNAYFANFVGYLIVSFAFYLKSIPLVLLSSVVAGIFNANLSATQILIGQKKENDKLLGSYSFMLFILNFGLLVSSLVCSFVFNIRGEELLFYFFLIVPPSLSLMNFFLVGRNKLEIPEGITPLQKTNRFNLVFFLSVVFFSAAWTFFIKFFQIHAIENLHFSQDFVAKFLRYLSIGAFLNLCFLPSLKRGFTAVFSGALLALGLLVYLILQEERHTSLAFLIIGISFFYHVCYSLYPYIVKTHLVHGKEWIPLYYFSSGVGKVVAPFFGGLYALITQKLPFLITFILLILSMGLFSILMLQNKTLKQSIKE